MGKYYVIAKASEELLIELNSCHAKILLLIEKFASTKKAYICWTQPNKL